MNVFELNIYAYLAIALLLSLLSSKLMGWVKLPNVTGYLVFGLLAGPYCLKILSHEIVARFAIVPDIALGFIAFSIGAEFKYAYLKQAGKTPIVIAILEGIGASLCSLDPHPDRARCCVFHCLRRNCAATAPATLWWCGSTMRRGL